MRLTHTAGSEGIGSSCDSHFEPVSDGSSWNARGDFLDGRRAIAVAIPSIVVKPCRGSRRQVASGVHCCSVAVSRSAVVGFVTWKSLRRNWYNYDVV